MVRISPIPLETRLLCTDVCNVPFTSLTNKSAYIIVLYRSVGCVAVRLAPMCWSGCHLRRVQVMAEVRSWGKTAVCVLLV